jgi:hypothetical protein
MIRSSFPDTTILGQKRVNCQSGAIGALENVARAWRDGDRSERLARRLPRCVRGEQNLFWVRTFRDAEGLRLALIAFRQTYNEHWLIERNGYRAPAQFRRGQVDTLSLAA